MSSHNDAPHDQKPITMRIVASDYEQLVEENIQLLQDNLRLLKENAEAMSRAANLEKVIAAHADRNHKLEKQIEDLEKQKQNLFSPLSPTTLPDGAFMTTPTEGQTLPSSGIIQPNN